MRALKLCKTFNLIYSTLFCGVLVNLIKGNNDLFKLAQRFGCLGKDPQIFSTLDIHT